DAIPRFLGWLQALNALNLKREDVAIVLTQRNGLTLDLGEDFPGLRKVGLSAWMVRILYEMGCNLTAFFKVEHRVLPSVARKHERRENALAMWEIGKGHIQT